MELLEEVYASGHLADEAEPAAPILLAPPAGAPGSAWEEFAQAAAKEEVDVCSDQASVSWAAPF